MCWFDIQNSCNHHSLYWRCRVVFTGRYWFQHHPSTWDGGHWYCLQAPRIPRYSGGWPSPMWWITYYGHIRMYFSKVTAIWWQCIWPGVSEWPLPWYPSGRPLSQKMGENGGATEGKQQIIYIIYYYYNFVFIIYCQLSVLILVVCGY